MNENDRSTIILSLAKSLKENRSWCGSTHLQKAVFFLQQLTGVDLGYNFILYKHGPFSATLRDEVSMLLGNYFLVMIVDEEPYGPKYQVSDFGKGILKDGKDFLENYKAKIEYVARLLGGEGISGLERLGTALYMIKTYPDWDDTKRSEKIHELKPHISIEKATESLSQVHGFIAEASENFALCG